MQAYDSVIGGYFSFGFIYFVIKVKSLTDFTNLFSPNDLRKYYIILNYFLTNL